jgi:hypothetical protein
LSDQRIHPYNHIDVYLDESGDLGLTPGKSSQYLVIATTATPDQGSLERVTKKARRRLNAVGKRSVEFKFNKSSEEMKQFFLENISALDCWITWGAINKFKAVNSLKFDKNELYQYVCGRVLADTFKVSNCKDVRVILDRRMLKWNDYVSLNNHIQKQLLLYHAGNFVPRLTINHNDSRLCPELQAHDFVVGSIFQMVDRSDPHYIDYLKNKVSGYIYI